MTIQNCTNTRRQRKRGKDGRASYAGRARWRDSRSGTGAGVEGEIDRVCVEGGGWSWGRKGKDYRRRE